MKYDVAQKEQREWLEIVTERVRREKENVTMQTEDRASGRMRLFASTLFTCAVGPAAGATPCKLKQVHAELTPDKVAEKGAICELFKLYDDFDDADSVGKEDNDEDSIFLSKSLDPKVNAVSASVGRRVSAYAAKHRLDEKVKARIMDCSDQVAENVISTELSKRVRNPSAYVTRVLRDKAREEKDCGDGNVDDGAEQELVGEQHHSQENDVGQGAYADHDGARGCEGADDEGAWYGDEIGAGGQVGAEGQEGVEETEPNEGDEGGDEHGWQEHDPWNGNEEGGWYGDAHDEGCRGDQWDDEDRHSDAGWYDGQW